MKILDVRDGFIKFETDSSIYLSSFVLIEGMEKRYIAQVTQIKRSDESSIAYAKILFLYDGSLLPYDKTLPSKESIIKGFTSNILNNSINAKTPVIVGITPDNNTNIVIDASAFDKKMLVSIDGEKENNITTRNLVKQFNNIDKNVIVIDTLGVIRAHKITAGVDFKLPLDTASLSFMYQDCLNDATADSKSLIIEIFKDLSDYSKTVPFVPFGALKSIVDDMVDKSHVFKLLVLKNKLAKFEKLGYFAKDKQEIDKINSMLKSKCAIIDLSKLDAAFQNRYLAYLYEKIAGKENTHVILELSNVISKKNLKNIMSTDDISTTFITHSRFKYLNDIKNLFDNFIIFPSFANNEIFNIYNTFLKAMSPNTYLITGEAVNYIPLISRLDVINSVIQFNHPTETAEPQEVTPEEPETVVAEEIETAVEEPVLPDLEEIAEEEIQADIVEPIEEDIIQEEQEEIVEENRITNEEILANIEEKSEAVISEAAKDLTPPDNMFDDDDDNVAEDSTDNAIEIPDESSEESFLEEENDVITEVDNDEENKEEEDLSDIEELTLEDSIYSTAAAAAAEEEEEEEEEHSNKLEESEQDDFLITEENYEPLEEIAEDTTTSNAKYEEFVTDFGTDDSKYLNDNTPLILEMPEDFNLNFEQEVHKAQESEINDESDLIPLSDDSSDFDEIIELVPDDSDENDIVIDMEENDDEEDEMPENIDEQIVKDVDKVFTTRKDDDISDSDLDFIDQLNNDDGGELIVEESEDNSVLEELSNEDILDEPQEQIDLKDNNDGEDILETRNSSTPIVPVYDADIPQEDLVMSDQIEQGDTVTHAKYGSGVVEKMIKYGNKTLFSINFDNIGRRLLDPTLTEIKLLHS